MTKQGQITPDLYKSLVLNSGDAMFLFDQKGKIFEANSSACKSLNYTREELLNLSVPDINPDFNTPEIIETYLKKLVNDKSVKLFSKHKRKDGSFLSVEISLSLLIENDEPLILGIARDITEHLQDKANLSSYIETLDKIHPILEEAENINKMISEILKLVQKTFSVDRTFLIATNYSTNKYHIQPMEIVNNQFQTIFNKKNNSQIYSRIIVEDIKKDNSEIYLWSDSMAHGSKNFKNDLFIHSEMIVPILKIGSTPYLFGVHQCSTKRIWTNLEQKLFLDISRRLADSITRIINNHTIKQSEEKYKTLYDYAPFGYHSLDTNGNLVGANKTWLNLLGYTKEEIIGKNYGDLLHPDYLNNFSNNFPLFKERGHVHDVHFKLKRKNGKYLHISLEGSTSCHPDGTFKQTYCVIQDISARMKAENELRTSESKFKAFVQQAPIPLSHVDNITGEVKYINNRFLDLFGYTHDDVSTMEKWWQLAYPDSKYRKWAINNWQKAVELAKKNNTDIIPEVYNMSCKDGRVKQILVSGITLGDDFLSMLVDLTAQKKIEQELITAKEKAEENEKLKTAFLANMSHEIRTPMNGILGFADLLQTPKLSEEKREKYIQIILQSGKRMLSTINSIIEISKIETKQITPSITEINLTELFQNQCAFFTPEANKKDIKLFCKPLINKKSIVSTDYTLLNSICTNLINNAIKYTNNGTIEFGCTQRKNSLEFFVKDTGIGIPKKLHHNIFDRFTRVDQDNTKVIEGSGLGLSITKAYVEILGGKIWMESKEGIGSQFYFTIPIKS